MFSNSHKYTVMCSIIGIRLGQERKARIAHDLKTMVRLSENQMNQIKENVTRSNNPLNVVLSLAHEYDLQPITIAVIASYQYASFTKLPQCPGEALYKYLFHNCNQNTLEEYYYAIIDFENANSTHN